MLSHKSLLRWLGVITVIVMLAAPAGQPALANPPANDEIEAAMQIPALPFTDAVDMAQATGGPGDPVCFEEEPARNTVWYQFTPQQDGLLQARVQGDESADVSAFLQVEGGMDPLAYCGGDRLSPLAVQAGATYYFLVRARQGVVTFTLEAGTPPANDEIENATAIGELPYSDTVDLSMASRAPDDPTGEEVCTGYYSPLRTVWYTYTAGANSVVTVTLHGPYTVNVVAFRGSPGSLMPLGCRGYDDEITFRLWMQAGSTYYFLVNGSEYVTGEVTFSLTPVPAPANDNIIDAMRVTSLPFENDTDLSAATVEPGEPIPSCVPEEQLPVSKTVWYRFTPDTYKQVLIPIPSAWFNPVVGVYSGSPESLTEVGCLIETGTLLIGLGAGTTYYFQLGGLNGGGWQATFYIQELTPPTASFGYGPSDPSRYDTVRFSNLSHDPAGMAMSSAWDFGDGSSSTEYHPEHQYARDGDYRVLLTVTTSDGRTDHTEQVVSVWTHDVGIVRYHIPRVGHAGQTVQIQVWLASYVYPENVLVILNRYVGTSGSAVGSETKLVPVAERGGQKLARFTFPYTFTEEDAQVGEVLFTLQAEIQGPLGWIRDAQPADNWVQAEPTRVKNSITSP